MNRKFNQLDPSASLDLMLDVLSNVFGGVILISCLLAILPRHSAPPPLWPSDLANSEMIERRSDAARQQLESLNREIKRIEESGDSRMASFCAERDRLKTTLESLEKDIDALSEQEESMAESRAIIASGSIAELSATLQKLEVELAAAENLNAATAGKIAFLEKRLKSLEEEKREIAKGKVYAVRFPKEKGDGGSPLPILLRHGMIYSMAVGADLDENTAIRRIPVDDDAFIASPVPGRGWVLPKDIAILARTLRAAKARGLYISIYLYPDSHGKFQDLKAQIFAAKIGYGLEFVPTERNLIFSSEGSKPPEL
jgi:hypothetical protein